MNIQELDAYNLDDAVKFNDRLNPKLWDANEHLKPKVRDRLLEIAEDFREFLGITDLDLKDITISGSNAAYTYTPNSDIDLHLVVAMPDNEVYRELFDAKKAQYNDQHNITIGGNDVELYIETAGEPPISQGMYSIINNDWIQVPRRVKSDVDDASTRNKFETVGHAIERSVGSGDLTRMDQLARKIKKMRQTGLEAHGEFGPENLAFKMLRSQGKIKELHDARIRAKDQELSLQEKAPPRPFVNGFKSPARPKLIKATPTLTVAEDVATPTDEEILKDFIRFCVNELKIESMPIVKLRKDPQWSVRNKTFGRYINDEHLLEVSWGQRHIMDVLRTVAHELTHKHQHERDGSRMGPDAGETGSPWENEANARAGILMRDYGRLHPELFDASETELEESASGYIPTKKQAKDPRWSMALTQDIKPGQLGKEANKLNLKTNKQGVPQVANPNGLFEKLALELSQFKRNGTLSESEQLDEVRMAPSNLMQWAKSPEAEGIRAGFEAELIFRDTTSGDDDNGEMEPDYDMDERCHSLDQIVNFFENGDYGYMSQRQANQLREKLDEQYYEWYDEQRYEDWQDNREELVRDAHLEETSWEDRIHAFLVDGMEMTDEQADAVQALAKQREDGKIKGSEMSEEQLDMITAYSEAKEGADDILDEDVEQSINKEDAIYERAKEEFDDNFSLDDDSGFFTDVGLRWMSDIAESFDLDWPYMTGSNGNDGSRDWEGIGDSLHDTIDMPVKVSSGYHQATRKEGMWIVEPDSSLEPDDREDYGLEIVSPPMPLLTALDKLQEVCDWANDPSEGNAYTNSSTGLHMGVSVPYKGGNVDYVKLIMFLGDEYVLQSFGRAANTYCASAMGKLKQNVGNSNARYAANVTNAMELMRGNLIELANREVQKGVGESKYTSVHIQKGYIEFRSAGGDWLAEESADPEKLSSTMLRYARAMQIAADPSAERREYAKKLYKLIAPEGDDALGLFSQFTAGELDKEQLKKRWAEKTIGTEKKMNQRWKLYQMVDGVWTAVPGAEWNGYSEDQVKTAVWSKYGRESLDSGEYQLVNMGEQSWEVYDVKTGKTLEIVKGKSKGEVADKVYDKYVDQGIGFQVRPYEDPATMTPRAKLAKRITQPKKVDYNYEVVDKSTGQTVEKLYGKNRDDAYETFVNWARDRSCEPFDFELRQIGQPQEAPADVAQNFNQPQDATQRVGSWSIYDVTLGREIYRLDDISFQQASDRADELERNTGHNMSVRGLSENFADGKGPGRPGDSQRHGIPKGATMTELEKAAKAPGRKGQLARWQLNMRRGKKK